MKDRLVIGTRGSKLALRQTQLVVDRLQKLYPELPVEMQIIKTVGDKILDHSLAKIDDKGLFTKEIETALLEKTIDAAVHSLKDLPTTLPAGLHIGAVLPREDPRDVLIAGNGRKLAELPAGARIGTGSPRRMAQLLALRADLACVDIRGNLDTRLRKLAESGQYDALIVARAGLARLGLLDRVTEVLDYEQMLPAPGQGALAIECREDDAATLECFSPLDDTDTAAAVRAERAFLRRLEGGCQVPLGAAGVIEGEKLTLHGMVATHDGRRLLRRERHGAPDEAEKIGRELAEEMLQQEPALLQSIFSQAEQIRRT
ncbi:MAG: hydroxymethylbilane synthase [Alphaproteobacteria bacterium]